MQLISLLYQVITLEAPKKWLDGSKYIVGLSGHRGLI